MARARLELLTRHADAPYRERVRPSSYRAHLDGPCTSVHVRLRRATNERSLDDEQATPVIHARGMMKAIGVADSGDLGRYLRRIGAEQLIEWASPIIVSLPHGGTSSSGMAATRRAVFC
jgi:hypothetical protein